MHISAPPAARPVGPGKFGDRDRGPRAGGCGAVRAGGAARLGADLRVYIWAPPGRHRRPRRHRTRKRTVGPAWSVSGPEELLESERALRVDACSAMHLGTAGRETRKGPALSAARCHDSERVPSGICRRLGGAARLGTDLIYAPTMTLQVCYRTAALPTAAAGPAASGPEEHIKTFRFRGY